MNLRKKKQLAKKILGVGEDRIVFVKPRLDEIKEVITKQDIRDLIKEGAIIVKDKKGRKTVQKRKRKRGTGKVKMKVNRRKQDYVILTRKLRKHVHSLKVRGEISKEDYYEIRKKIRNSDFRNLAQLKEQLKTK